MTHRNAALIAHLLREALEVALSPAIASAVLFDALADEPGSAIPTEAGALRDFLDVRLRDAVARQLGDGQADDAIEQLHARLAAAIPAPRASEKPTASVSRAEGPVPVLVVSTQPGLADRLRGALGPELVAPYLARDASAATRAITALHPPVAVVDGKDAAIADEAVDALASGHALILVWAADRPRGQAIAERLSRSSARCVPLSGEHAAQTLVDYLRSYSATSRQG